MNKPLCRFLRARRRVGIALVSLLMGWAVPSVAAPTVEAHGSLDAYAGPGVALAWGVLRGANADAATVVVRVDVDPKRYRTLTVSGVDPFTKATQVLVTPTALDGGQLIRLPRTRFADLPRTEWRFYAVVPSAVQPTDAPPLLVYYQGIPDTTPEFNDEGGLATSLEQRIERVRSGR